MAAGDGKQTGYRDAEFARVTSMKHWVRDLNPHNPLTEGSNSATRSNGSPSFLGNSSKVIRTGGITGTLPSQRSKSDTSNGHPPSPPISSQQTPPTTPSSHHPPPVISQQTLPATPSWSHPPPPPVTSQPTTPSLSHPPPPPITSRQTPPTTPSSTPPCAPRLTRTIESKVSSSLTEKKGKIL